MRERLLKGFPDVPWFGHCFPSPGKYAEEGPLMPHSRLSAFAAAHGFHPPFEAPGLLNLSGNRDGVRNISQPVQLRGDTSSAQIRCDEICHSGFTV